MIPTFAVIGRVNEGKSSVVAALTENDQVAIGPLPGTTQRTELHELTCGGRTVCRVYDTPGFQQPEALYAWLAAQEDTASARRAALRRFVADPTLLPELADERELLRPLLDEEATILYVVDGSHPLRPSYELEMRLLNWTGQPRFALLNSTGPELYQADWDAPLRQYFQAIRRFDAVHVRFSERLRLLSLLAEAEERFRAGLEAAVRCLAEDRSARRRVAARAVAELVADVTLHVERAPLGRGEPEAAAQAAARQAYQDYVARRERDARQAVLRAFGFTRPPVVDQAPLASEGELFSRRVYQMLGLEKAKLIAYGTAAGAAAGLGLDAALVGHSFGLGALVGAVIGGLPGAVASLKEPEWQVPGARLVGLGSGLEAGFEAVVGPHPSPQFRWVVLDRALLHVRAVMSVSHAVQTSRPLAPSAATDQSGKRGLVSSLGARTEAALEAQFQRLSGWKGRLQSRQVTLDALTDLLAQVLARLDA